MIERVLSFGRHQDQVGILCLPDVMPTDDRPAVVMWNVGVNHRVGPFRFYVDLCRALAAQGTVAMRFDASGMGDSEVRRDALGSSEREDLDVKEALDAVTRRTGRQRFVIVGFCSSIDAAHRVSVKDERVVGVVHIEGYAFKSEGFRKRIPLRVFSAERWRRLAARQRARLERRLSGQAPQEPAEAVFKRDYPTWPQFSADLVTLTRRGVSMHFAYVGNDSWFNHVEQFWEMFATPGLDRRLIDVTYYPTADHTFFDLGERTTLQKRICAWVHAHHG